MSLEMRGKYYFFRKTINGHTIARSTKTDDPKLAAQIAATWEAEHIKSILIAGIKPVKLHEAIKAFLKSRIGTGGHANAVQHLRHFQALPDQPLKSVMLADLMNVIQKRRDAKISDSTLAVTVGYWNAVMAFCDKQGWQSGLRLDRIRAGKGRIRVLTREEEQKLFAVLDPNAPYRGKNPINDERKHANYDLMLGLLHIGCRLNELQRMKWSQVDMTNRRVWVIRSKRGVDSFVAMSDRLFAMFERRFAQYGSSQFVFPSKAVAKVNTTWINDAVKRAGIDESLGAVTLHVMRHTHASRLVGNGVSILDVQSQLGHRHLSSSMVYMHNDKDEASKRAAQIMNQF